MEENGVERVGAEGVECHLPAREFGGLKSQFDKRRAQRTADRRFVVDNKDSQVRLSHGVLLWFSVAVAAAPEFKPVILRSGMAAKNVVPAVSSLETHTDPL